MLLKLRRFLRNDLGFVKLWILPVWIALGFAKLAIFSRSFKRLAPKLGVSMGLNPWIPVLDTAQALRAGQISRVVQLAARYTPWDSNCFPQAIVSTFLLNWYSVPYVVFFGLRPAAETGRFDAHAWVAAGRVRVCGGHSFHQYTVVGVFAAPVVAADLTVTA